MAAILIIPTRVFADLMNHVPEQIVATIILQFCVNTLKIVERQGVNFGIRHKLRRMDL